MNSSQTFHDHVRELRNRILVVLLCVGLFSVIGYVLRNPIVNFIQRPIASPLYYNTPAGAFNLVFKISFIVGIFLSIPIIVYNLIRFLEPAFSKKIKGKQIIGSLFFSCLLAVMGAAFGYYILLPLSLHFFGGYSSKNISALISANEYFNYVINLGIAFALLFQIPLIIDFINRISPIKPSQLLKYQKHVIVIAIIIAIALPFTFDPITQFVVAVPIIILYYLSILSVMFSNRGLHKKQAIEQAVVYYAQPVTQPVLPIYEPTPAHIEAHEVISANTRPKPRYFDVVPARKSPVVNPKTSIKQATIKSRPIQKTRFVDGFRPIINNV